MTTAEVGIVIACADWERKSGRPINNIRISENGAKLSYAHEIDDCTSCVPTQIHFARPATIEQIADAAKRICRELGLSYWDKFNDIPLADIPIR